MNLPIGFDPRVNTLPRLSVCLENVSVRYRLPHERISSLKEYAIQWIHGRIRFREILALSSVNLTVVQGEIVGIVGSNGAGKSTLLKVVAQILRPQIGRVRVWGKIAPLIEIGAGLENELTARENIFLSGAILGYSKKHIMDRLANIVDFSELHDFLDVPLRNYSTGMLARLAFSIASDTESDVLIVDEVLSVGDTAFQKKSFERIEAFRKSGMTILLVTHNLNAVQQLCQRVIWLEKGTIRETGSPSIVLPNYLESQIAKTNHI